MAITESWLKSQLNKPRDKVEEHTDRDAMSVRASCKGKLTFQLRYRYAGKPCRLDLGSYPNISLKDARIAAAKYKAVLEQGYNPKQVKLQELSSIQHAYTFKEMFNLWYEKYCVFHKKDHTQIYRTFEMYVFPSFGLIHSDSIGLNDWFKLLDPLSHTIPAIANRVLLNAKQVLQWGCKRDIIKLNVLASVSAYKDLHIKTNIKERTLSDIELAIVYQALYATKMSYKNKLFIQLLMIYGCRVGELRLAKKIDFNLEQGIWTVPAENHKTGKHSNKPLIRPITDNIKPYIVEALRFSGGENLFTRTRDDEPMQHKSHSSIVRSITEWSIKNNTPLDHWSIHDLRRTVRTNLSTITEPHIAEVMLGHALPKIWRTYDRYDYLEEQANAYSTWVRKLEAIWKGRTLK